MGSTFRALIAEDDPVSRAALSNALVRLGFGVSIADDSEAAISRMREEAFDAVFSALCIRQSGGRAIARWVRDNCPTTRCFILTGWKGELENTLLQFEGIDGVVHKPLLFNEIRDMVLEHLG